MYMSQPLNTRKQNTHWQANTTSLKPVCIVFFQQPGDESDASIGKKLLELVKGAGVVLPRLRGAQKASINVLGPLSPTLQNLPKQTYIDSILSYTFIFYTGFIVRSILRSQSKFVTLQYKDR